MRSDHWTVKRAELLESRSHFSAVKYKRQAYFMGGCPGISLEMFDLDTGIQNCWSSLQAASLDSCSALIRENILIGQLNDGKFLTVRLNAKVVAQSENIIQAWVGVSKRMWVVKDFIVMMLDSRVEIRHVVLSTKLLSQYP